MVGLGLSLKIQDWIWIAKYYSLLISVWVCGTHPIKLIVTLLVPDRPIKGKSQKSIER